MLILITDFWYRLERVALVQDVMKKPINISVLGQITGVVGKMLPLLIISLNSVNMWHNIQVKLAQEYIGGMEFGFSCFPDQPRGEIFLWPKNVSRLVGDGNSTVEQLFCLMLTLIITQNFYSNSIKKSYTKYSNRAKNSPR